jgi:hypothetical protein
MVDSGNPRRRIRETFLHPNASRTTRIPILTAGRRSGPRPLGIRPTQATKPSQEQHESIPHRGATQDRVEARDSDTSSGKFPAAEPWWPRQSRAWRRSIGGRVERRCPISLWCGTGRNVARLPSLSDASSAPSDRVNAYAFYPACVRGSDRRHMMCQMSQSSLLGSLCPRHHTRTIGALPAVHLGGARGRSRSYNGRID